MKERKRPTRFEWIVFGLLAMLCIASMGMADLARAYQPEDEFFYVLVGVGFFGTAVLWIGAVAMRILNEERGS